MTKKLSVLLIQEEKEMIMCVKSQLIEFGYELYCEAVNSLDSIKAVLQKKMWDVVICDYSLKNVSSFEALLFIKEYDSYLPFILVADEINCNSIVKFMKNGCTNYVNKKEISMLIDIIESEIEEARLRKEKQKLFEKLKYEKEEAQAANMAKTLFLANMSHEIRTPLNGIDGMIDLTLRTELMKEQKENLYIAKECSNSLMEIINNILDFSKIQTGNMELKKSEFSIKELLQMTTKTNIVHAREKGIELICNINPDLDEKFFGDYSRIQQILNNLVSNAIKFTNKGSVCIAAKRISEEKDNPLLRFSVTDTGIGIIQEDIDKLFKSFSQVDGTYTRKYGGTGLGLIISKKLAELMGGEITLESIKGKGSTFYLTIKIERFNSSEMVKKTEKYNYEDDKFSNIPRDILLVEDNKANQEVLSKMCIKMNHRVKIADDGKKALEILNNEIFDLILMDIQMPVMDGIEATRIIRENEKKYGGHIPIIAVTAYALKGDKEKFLKLGIDEYLSKPIIMDELYKCIENIIFIQKDFKYHNAEYYLNLNETNNNFEDRTTSIENIHIEIDKLKEAIEKEDFINCENITHALKRYAADVKSIIMKNASFRAELAARRKDIKIVKEQLTIIEDEYIRIQ